MLNTFMAYGILENDNRNYPSFYGNYVHYGVQNRRLQDHTLNIMSQYRFITRETQHLNTVRSFIYSPTCFGLFIRPSSGRKDKYAIGEECCGRGFYFFF
jgi:hypothetical protein